MAADPAEVLSQRDELRGLVPLFALAVAIVAPIVDPGSAAGVALAVIPVGAFAAWAYLRSTSLAVVAVAVVVPVIVAQRSGALEPLLFDVSLLAFVVARWSRTLATALALGVLALAAPVAVAVVQDPAEVAVGVWMLGIAFPWAIGFAVARQRQLALELQAAQRELAEQAMVSQRRQIARDVHDLVGHGLAAVMLQVTSARHVLRRDPDAAEEALRSAEDVGRRSMRELRRTVALLRSDEGAELAPLPGAGQIPGLVDEARAAGLAVELRLRGELSRIPAGVGLSLYRIAQEALANASRHAPRARTTLGLELADGDVVLVAETAGPVMAAAAREPGRPHYGLIGMRERAAALGGELTAGPTSDGWRVSCRLPLDADGEPMRETPGR